MDIVAKHIPADENGVRMAALDEMTYRQKLWNHRPITDFWRVGKGIARRLEKEYIYTMGDIARQSVRNEGLLYKLFGVNAELLIGLAMRSKRLATACLIKLEDDTGAPRDCARRGL